MGSVMGSSECLQVLDPSSEFYSLPQQANPTMRICTMKSKSPLHKSKNSGEARHSFTARC